MICSFGGSICHVDNILALCETVRKRFDKLKHQQSVSQQAGKAAQAHLDRWCWLARTLLDTMVFDGRRKTQPEVCQRGIHAGIDHWEAIRERLLYQIYRNHPTKMKAAILWATLFIPLLFRTRDVGWQESTVPR